MTKIDLSNLNIEKYIESIDTDKLKSKLKKLKPRKYKAIIDNINLILNSDLNILESQFLNLCDGFNAKELKDIEKAFNYSGYRKKPKFFKNFKQLNIKSCPFCNNNYIYFYKEDASTEYNTLATLEHYYSKAKYPHLSLSFYNLIPCCSICNSKFKGSDNKHLGKICHPYRDDFNEKAEFSLKLKRFDKNLELDIDLKTYDKKAETSVDRFKLDEIYKEHDDIAKEIWNKSQYYNDSRIDELHKEFYEKLGYSKEDVKNIVFCNYLNKDDINKRNHSKLTQDILKQFDIGI